MSSTIYPSSILAADVGSVWTRLLLIERVGGAYRLVASGDAPTTPEDIVQGVQSAARALERTTGRRLLDSQGNLLPGGEEGVDRFVVATNAAPPLRVAAGGVVERLSAASARRAALSVPAEITDLFILDSSAGRWGNPQGAAGVVERLSQHWPDAIVLAGGTEGSTDRALLELVRAVRLAVEACRDNAPPTVIFAGNSALHAQVQQTLGEAIPLHLTPNVRPTLSDERTREVGRLLDGRARTLALQRVPGLDTLAEWSGGLPLSNGEALARVVQFLAVRGEQSVLGLDVGRAGASLAVTFRNRVTQTLVRANLGVPPDAAHFAETFSIESLMGWVPGFQSANEVLNGLLNLSLQPMQVPMTREGLRALHAAAREAARGLLDEARAGWPTAEQATAPRFETVLLAGDLLRGAPHPEQALMIALDTIQPGGITEVLRDREGLVPAIGALAEAAPPVAANLIEGQGFERLALVITPLGSAEPGTQALQFRLSQAGGQTAGTARVGELVRFPVLGTTRLELQPAAGFDIGFGPGAGVEITRVDDSVGIFMDLRGRPLPLPADVDARRRRVEEWLRYAGA